MIDVSVGVFGVLGVFRAARLLGLVTVVRAVRVVRVLLFHFLLNDNNNFRCLFFLVAVVRVVRVVRVLLFDDDLSDLNEALIFRLAGGLQSQHHAETEEGDHCLCHRDARIGQRLGIGLSDLIDKAGGDVHVVVTAAVDFVQFLEDFLPFLEGAFLAENQGGTHNQQDRLNTEAASRNELGRAVAHLVLFGASLNEQADGTAWQAQANEEADDLARHNSSLVEGRLVLFVEG